MLNELLLHPAIDADPSHAASFFLAIKSLTASRSPQAIWNVLKAIDLNNWLKTNSLGRPLLEILLGDLQDGAAMTAGFLHAWSLGTEFRLQFFRRCLLDNNVTVLPVSMDTFLREVGCFFGRCAFFSVDGAPNNLRLLLEAMLTTTPTTGILADITRYVAWVEAVAFGAKEEIKYHGIATTNGVLNDYGHLVGLIWQAIERHPICHVKNSFFAIILHPIETAADNQIAKTLWRSLEKTIFQVLAKGERDHIQTIVFAIRDKSNRLGALLLLPFVEALQGRIGTIPNADLADTSDSRWQEVLAYASDLLVGMACAPDCRDVDRDRIFALLQDWGRKGCGQAIEAARKVRTAP